MIIIIITFIVAFLLGCYVGVDGFARYAGTKIAEDPDLTIEEKIKIANLFEKYGRKGSTTPDDKQSVSK